jgi:MFS family permease
VSTPCVDEPTSPDLRPVGAEPAALSAPARHYGETERQRPTPQAPHGPASPERFRSALISWGKAGGRATSWQVLRHRRFRRYFIGSLVSNLGTWLQNTAQMLLAYKITHSVFAVGLIAFFQFSGFLLIGPWAGTLANRMGMKRVLIGTQVLSAIVAGSLALLILLATLTEAELVIGALGTGIALTFALPVQNAMVSALVDEKDTKAAFSMNSVSYNGGRTLAPILCLLVLAYIGPGWAFALNAMTFVFFAVIIAGVYPQMSPQTKPERAWSGLRFAVRRPRIMLLLAMVAAVTVADDPVQVLGPGLARQLSVSSIWPAFFLSALGLGTVFGALLPTRPSTARRAAIPLATLAVSVIIFAFGFSAQVSFAAAVAAGVSGLLTGAAAQALLLQQAGPRHATQVMALWAVAWAGTKPIASIADGWLGSTIGVRWAAVLLAVPAIGVAVLERCPERWFKAVLKKFIREYNGSRGLALEQASQESFAPPQELIRQPDLSSPATRIPPALRPGWALLVLPFILVFRSPD